MTAGIPPSKPPMDPATLFPVTFFADYKAKAKKEGRLSLEGLARRISIETASVKGDLPWLKLATFGEQKTDNLSLRHDSNVLSITGIEADYDAEQVHFEEAVELLTKAGILALVYTSPSHTEDAHRWRVLCPLSEPMAPAIRGKMMGRLNGLFRGILAGESWTLSQSYYFGSVASNPSHRVELVDGTPIDEHDELDAIWMGKPQTQATAGGDGKTFTSGAADEPALLKQIAAGESYHTAYTRLLGKWALTGVSVLEAKRRIVAAMESVPEAERDSRWKFRLDDLDRCVLDIYGKEAKAVDDGRRQPARTKRAAPPPADVGTIEADREGIKDDLARSDKGNIFPSTDNALAILSRDPEFAGVLGYDDFTSQALLLKSLPPILGAVQPGPFPRPWQHEDSVLVQVFLQRAYHVQQFSRQTADDAMGSAAARNRYHPVRDWLAKQVWDKKPRIDRFLQIAFGAEANAYHSSVGAKFLIAAVRRVRQPGCKFDQLPVLEGSQGIGKSRAVKALFGEQWFSDAMPPNLADKDAAMALLGVWGLELGEIDHLIRAEVETVKAFLSRGVDRYRPPYGRSFVERPRQGVLIGTTNSTDYLRDTTGNRRIWPVRCRWADVVWIDENRDQLWAEAAIREATGEALWLEDDATRATAEGEQHERLAEDPWETIVRKFLHNKDAVTTSEILQEALFIPFERMTRANEQRVGKILRSFEWSRHREMIEGQRHYNYKPKPAPGEGESKDDE